MQIHPEDAPGLPGPDLPRLLRWLRLKHGTHEAQEAAALWAEAQALAHPATWRAKMLREDFLTRFHPYAQASAHLTRVLAGCPQIWLLVATIGPALEIRSAAYFEQGRAFASYVLDRMGTALVEQTMRDLARSCGPDVTRRYSPGYKDFALEAQRPLVEMVGKALPELQRTSGCMLQPAKSITAVMGARTP